jgi:serine/threonine protein kinase
MTQVGTPMWMAPEIIMGKKYTEKADVYAFGIILWEILTRLEPYEEKEPMQIVVEVVNDGLRPTMPADCADSPLVPLMKGQRDTKNYADVVGYSASVRVDCSLLSPSVVRPCQTAGTRVRSSVPRSRRSSSGCVPFRRRSSQTTTRPLAFRIPASPRPVSSRCMGRTLREISTRRHTERTKTHVSARRQPITHLTPPFYHNLSSFTPPVLRAPSCSRSVLLPPILSPHCFTDFPYCSSPSDCPLNRRVLNHLFAALPSVSLI